LKPLFDVVLVSALGKVSDDIWYKWEPLYKMDEKEAASIEKTMSEVFDKIRTTGLIADDVLSKVQQTWMTESGQYPGIDKALEEFEGSVPAAFETPEELDEESNNLLAPPKVTADAAPRTLYVSRAVLNRSDLVKWAVSQGFSKSEIIPDLHVTICYSNAPVDWMQTGEPWEENISVPSGGARLMEQFGKHKVLLFRSSTIEYRHSQFIRYGASHDYPEYQPHISIVKEGGPNIENIEPYTGSIVLGPEIYQEVKQ